MMDILYYMASACLVGGCVGFIFLIVVGIFELINFLTKGKFETAIVNFFSEENYE